MTPNAIVVVLRELAANERMAAVISTTMMEPGSNPGAWWAVLSALRCRGEMLRQQLALEDPATVAAAEALIAAALQTTPTRPATPALPAWTTGVFTVGTRLH